MSKTVSFDEIYALFPVQLLQDSDNLRALATVAALELWTLWRQGDLTGIYTRIDALDEALLDILAVDLKIDWYEKSSAVEKKRETVKNCWKVHKQLGTKGALVEAVSDIADGAVVTEWFDYDGDPFHFKLQITASETDMPMDVLRRVVERLDLFANVRSVLDDVTYNAEGTVFADVQLGLQERIEYGDAEIIRQEDET